MTVKELSDKLNLTIVNMPDENKQVGGAYTCDLLSWVIGRANLNDALITIMTNINTVAVAVIVDLSCIILAENVDFDEIALEKAKNENVCVLKSPLPSFELSAKVKKVFEEQ